LTKETSLKEKNQANVQFFGAIIPYDTSETKKKYPFREDTHQAGDS